jgi:hypothetical protein
MSAIYSFPSMPRGAPRRCLCLLVLIIQASFFVALPMRLAVGIGATLRQRQLEPHGNQTHTCHCDCRNHGDGTCHCGCCKRSADCTCNLSSSHAQQSFSTPVKDATLPSLNVLLTLLPAGFHISAPPPLSILPAIKVPTPPPKHWSSLKIGTYCAASAGCCGLDALGCEGQVYRAGA